MRYSNGSYQKDLTYNGDGQLATEKVTITGGAGGGYTTSYGYDAYLRPSTITYPDGEVVTTTYNGMGLPKALTSKIGSTTVTLVDTATYDAAGLPTMMRFPAGGNLYRHQLYYGWNSAQSNPYTTNDQNHRLAEIRVGTSSNWASDAASHNKLRLRYFYDSSGNITSMHEQYNAGTQSNQSFAYDNQNRLTSGYGKSYAYDNAGRITNFEGLATTPNTAFPRHALYKSASFSYDANGNLKSSPGRTLVWNVENRLHSVAGESYLYDENGIRLKKVVGSKSVYYPFAHYEPLVNGATTTVTKYYFFGGQRIATRQGSTLKHLHSDHLGGTVLETSGGFALADMSYWAYGRQRDSSPVSTSRRFTGQVYDGSGLYYMNARYYDPALGMFVSPDTIVPNPGQVVDYNRYAYARLNPLRFNDPTGHNPAEIDSGTGGEHLTVLFQLQMCGGNPNCERTNVGQWLIDNPNYDPFKDPRLGEHAGYKEVFRMLATISRESGDQELAALYYSMVNGEIIAQAPMDTGMSVMEGTAVSGAAVAGAIWTRGRLGNPVQNAFSHWRKHGVEFPEYANAKQYVEGTHRFVSEPPQGTLTKNRPNGDTLYYHPTSNTFAVTDASGTPRTMFRPSGEMSYWNRQ